MYLDSHYGEDTPEIQQPSLISKILHKSLSIATLTLSSLQRSKVECEELDLVEFVKKSYIPKSV